MYTPQAAIAAVQKDGGPHATFGLMMDYACLPQKPFANDGEKERFKRGLGSINR